MAMSKKPMAQNKTMETKPSSRAGRIVKNDQKDFFRIVATAA